MQIRVAGLIEESYVDGPGVRFVAFAQGCAHACPGCQNPQTHSRTGGVLMDTEELLGRMAANPLLDGLTLSGGEPFDQPEACRELARGARALGLDVMAWTGYQFERLIEEEGRLRLLRELDLLVDGPFVRERRSLDLLYRGSSNQRVLDVRASLERGSAVLWELARCPGHDV